jgi:predicted AAA+ superfamily ATPase
VKDYLKEEIADEALVRNIPNFSNFLSAAALSDGELVVYTNIASECSVSSNTVKEYFQILEDTLLGRFLPAYTRKPKRRTIQSPKFYFSDIGIVNHLCKSGKIVPKSELFGKAFENWVFHELNIYNAYNDKFFDFSYWKLTTGVEVDFIINNMEYAIEAKASSRIEDRQLKGLRELSEDFPSLKKRIIVSLVDKDRISNDGIEIINYQSFIRKLWKGSLLN